jgi:hypothetical protein
MAAEYQDPDWRVVDYQTFCLDERLVDPSTHRPLWIRGPRPDKLRRGEYAVFLGAAQTFGRFCQKPYPTLLGERLGLPILNISHGGAGALYFRLMKDALAKYLNEACFVVVQAMSARSESNSLFESQGVGHYRRRSDGALIGCDEAYVDLLKAHWKSYVRRIVQETRSNWCHSYETLFSLITVPKILFWFSKREPAYRDDYRNVQQLFSSYPQLVNADMVANVRRMCDDYVACVGPRGLPQTLFDRFTGETMTISDPWTSAPWSENWYYPSPEMHEDAAAALEPVCRRIMQSGRAP